MVLWCDDEKNELPANVYIRLLCRPIRHILSSIESSANGLEGHCVFYIRLYRITLTVKAVLPCLNSVIWTKMRQHVSDFR